MNDISDYTQAWAKRATHSKKIFLVMDWVVPGGGAIIITFVLIVHGLRRMGLAIPDGVIVTFFFVLFSVWGYF